PHRRTGLRGLHGSTKYSTRAVERAERPLTIDAAFGRSHGLGLRATLGVVVAPDVLLAAANHAVDVAPADLPAATPAVARDLPVAPADSVAGPSAADADCPAALIVPAAHWPAADRSRAVVAGDAVVAAPADLPAATPAVARDLPVAPADSVAGPPAADADFPAVTPAVVPHSPDADRSRAAGSAAGSRPDAAARCAAVGSARSSRVAGDSSAVRPGSASSDVA